jgi:hypothetical protein
MNTTTKRGSLLAKGRIQAVPLVTVFGFPVLGVLTYSLHHQAMTSLWQKH